MRTQQIAVATLGLLGACTGPAPAFKPSRLPATAPAAIVRDHEALFVFPTPDSLQPCSYRRHSEPELDLYSWTVNVGGAGEGYWYVIDTWPAVLPSAAARRPPNLSSILSSVRPVVGTAGGEPPMRTAVLDSTNVEARAVDGRVVVRLTRRPLIRRLFGRRPSVVSFVACHDGNDSWHRQISVQYEP